MIAEVTIVFINNCQIQMFSLQSDINRQESQLLLSLLQHQQEQEMTSSCLQRKKDQNSILGSRIDKIKEVIYFKEQTIENLEKEIAGRERDSQLYIEHIEHLQREAEEKRRQLDIKILKEIAVEVKPEDCLGEEEEGVWADLLGNKIKFVVPQNILSERWSIQDNGQDLTLKKMSKEAGYSRITSLHPLPSKGKYYLCFQCESHSPPSFLAGLTNQGPFLSVEATPSPRPSSISLNFSTMAFQTSSKVLRQCPHSFIQERSSVVFLFDCSHKKMLVIIDSFVAGEISLTELGEDYCYFFVGVGSNDTMLRFDHSDKFPLC